MTPKMTPAKIRAIRKRLGLTQAQLAGSLGVTPAAVCLWESGKRKPGGPACRLLTAL